ncbi:MAG TPA: hypothetical protein VK587_11905 [bacterium]|nr:hypothetical protein [bacterium]
MLERFDLVRRVDQGLRQRTTAASFSGRVDEIPKPPFFRGQLGFLQTDRFRDVAVETLDLCFDPPQDIIAPTSTRLSS